MVFWGACANSDCVVVVIKLCFYNFVIEVIEKLYLLLISHSWLIPDPLNEVSIGADTVISLLGLSRSVSSA